MDAVKELAQIGSTGRQHFNHCVAHGNFGSADSSNIALVMISDVNTVYMEKDWIDKMGFAEQINLRFNDYDSHKAGAITKEQASVLAKYLIECKAKGLRVIVRCEQGTGRSPGVMRAALETGLFKSIYGHTDKEYVKVFNEHVYLMVRDAIFELIDAPEAN